MVLLHVVLPAVYKDPNFPMADGRVHHLDVKAGEGVCSDPVIIVVFISVCFHM